MIRGPLVVGAAEDDLLVAVILAIECDAAAWIGTDREARRDVERRARELGGRDRGADKRGGQRDGASVVALGRRNQGEIASEHARCRHVGESGGGREVYL